MKRNVLLVLLACGLPCLAGNGTQPQVTRRTLASAQGIQGYPCAKGYAWFYADGRLNQCTVSRDAAFGEATVPEGSIIVLRPDGKPHHVFLSRDADIAGYRAMGGGLLGTAEGPVTAFYPSGKPKSIYLVGNQIVQGVPCRGGQWGIVTDPIGGGNAIVLYENGKLHGCKLTKDFDGVRRGQRIVRPPSQSQRIVH